MRAEFRHYNKKDIAVFCESPKSPYSKWLNLLENDYSSCIDVEFFCLLMVELAQEAIDRMEEESCTLT